MSIYATTFSLGDEHSARCTRITRVGPKTYKRDDSKPCTCECAPLIYQESHVLPSDRDKRGGVFMLAAIPGHITRDGRDDAPEGKGWHPWLRVSMFEVESDSFVLTRKQAKALRDALTDWLSHTIKKAARPKEKP